MIYVTARVRSKDQQKHYHQQMEEDEAAALTPPRERLKLKICNYNEKNELQVEKLQVRK